MLEILLLVSLTRKIAAIAERKGVKPGTWKLYVILAWFGGEFAGGFAGALLSLDRILIYLLAICCAVASYFLLRYKLNSMPDVIADDWINHIGEKEDRDASLPTQQGL